jgi:cell wall assembly regulator SMI1
MTAIVQVWNDFERQLRPLLGAPQSPFLPGVSELALRHFEAAVGFELPLSVRAFWSVCGGEAKLGGAGVACGFVLLSPQAALAEWQSLAQLRARVGDEELEALARPCLSKPPGTIREQYSLPGWIPLWKEPHEANYVGVDLDPGPNGVVGQVIGFGRDEDEKRVLFWDYAEALAWLSEQLQGTVLSVRMTKGGGKTIEHEAGRLLSMLGGLARNGELPRGKKPQRTPQNAYPPMLAAEASPDPLPTPERLPGAAQEALDKHVALLLACLNAEQRPALTQLRATSHQQLDRPRKPLESPVMGQTLMMSPTRPDVRCDSLAIRKSFGELARLSLEAGLVIRQLEVNFAREAGGPWRARTQLETFENYRRLIHARQALDAEIGATLVRFANETRAEWPHVSLSFDGNPEAKRTGLNVIFPYPRPVTVVPATYELRSLFERVQVLHARFGRNLYTASFSARCDNPGRVSVNTYYG